MLECSVDKPGNVGPGSSFSDTTYSDYILSSLLLGEHCGMAAVGNRFGGEILGFVEECVRFIGKNTHLGTAILLMPLAAAAKGAQMPMDMEDLRKNTAEVLSSAGVEDSIDVCRAIRLMNPSGLRDPAFFGPSIEELVENIRNRGLPYLEWMKLGAKNDGVALETVNMYHGIFRWAGWLLDRGEIRKNVLELYIRILSEDADTLIAGSRGLETAEEVTMMAGAAARAIDSTREFEDRIKELSEFCRREDANPGTTADLAGAAIYAALLCGGKA